MSGESPASPMPQNITILCILTTSAQQAAMEVVQILFSHLYRSRYGRQPSASRRRPALQGLPYPASGIFNRLEYITQFQAMMSFSKTSFLFPEQPPHRGIITNLIKKSTVFKPEMFRSSGYPATGRSDGLRGQKNQAAVQLLSPCQ
ncbi:MAG: hypothetical protein FWC50_11875 [Planctomycetaceae bacterium]|nr:hypothetical protein [Planctomycetaceae bacterium]